MIIREHRPEDFEALHRIDRAAFVPALAYSRAELQYYVLARRSKTLVAEVEGEVVGFVNARCAQRGWGMVTTLDVAPGWQRRGIGGKLMAAIEEGVRVVALETPADEGGARQFYEKHGYQLGGRVRGYYHGRLDAFSMVKRLAATEPGVP